MKETPIYRVYQRAGKAWFQYGFCTGWVKQGSQIQLANRFTCAWYEASCDLFYRQPWPGGAKQDAKNIKFAEATWEVWMSLEKEDLEAARKLAEEFSIPKDPNGINHFNNGE